MYKKKIISGERYERGRQFLSAVLQRPKMVVSLVAQIPASDSGNASLLQVGSFDRATRHPSNCDLKFPYASVTFPNVEDRLQSSSMAKQRF